MGGREGRVTLSPSPALRVGLEAQSSRPADNQLTAAQLTPAELTAAQLAPAQLPSRHLRIWRPAHLSSRRLRCWEQSIGAEGSRARRVLCHTPGARHPDSKAIRGTLQEQ